MNDWQLERFECKQEPDEPRYVSGVARRGKESTRFCIAGDWSNGFVLRVEETSTGLAFIRQFEQDLGPATLLYVFQCHKDKGYWAEWHFHGYKGVLNQRIADLKRGRISSDYPKGRVTFLSIVKEATPRRRHSSSNYIM